MKKMTAHVKEHATVLTKEEMKQVYGAVRLGCWLSCPPAEPIQVFDCNIAGQTCLDGSTPVCTCD